MSPRSSIAHYRITAKIGEGGMGEVWRATDTKLNRDVAIKVLPPVFGQDADRMARFTREAQVLASLNHPNVAAIYGVEERTLIMELAEGPTLAERIAQGPISLEDTFPAARQIAEALEYAHERGIIHRDLKPANIKISPEGRVKVLDFGLAKALSNETDASDPMSSPTLTMRATIAGAIMGTAAYMSPEQAKGKPVDRRADIWSFGVVLYEMLTGRQLYRGETVSETLASVIKDAPDLTSLPSSTPPAIRRMLARCLEKDPRRRLQAIGEARLTLEEPAEEAPPAAAQKALPAPRKAPWMIAGVLAVALIATLATLWRATRPVLQPMLRFNTDLGPEAVAGNHITVAISPDGTRIVFPAGGATGPLLATRLMQDQKPIILAGTEGGDQPFFSPDGQWIGFFADGKLKKISVQGGAAVTLCDTASLRGAWWGEDGNIIANLDLIHLFRLPAAGGQAQIIARPEDKGQVSYRFPQVLPGNQAVLLTAGTAGAFDEASIAVLSLKTGDLKVVARGGYFARYLPSGHLIYMHQATLFAVPFDLKRMEVRGTPTPVIEGIQSNPGPGSAELDFSQNGTFVYANGKSVAVQQAAWIDAKGTKTPLISGAAILTPRLSPNGNLLALSINRDIVVYDPQRGATSRITFTDAGNLSPVWTPDGKHIAYGSGRGGIWWTRSDGSSQPVKIIDTRPGSPPATPGSFSPDGRQLAFTQVDAHTGQDIWTVSLDVSDPDHPKPGKPALCLQTPVNDMDPAFSPDGRWLAYASAESGSLEVYVRPYRNGAVGAGKWQISTTQAQFPIWSRNGSELFYEAAGGHIMVVDYTAQGDTFSPSRPRQWSDAQIVSTGPFPNLDLAPDGKRFVAFPRPDSGGAEQSSLHATFLVNFFDELKRRVPESR